ncbi:MAG: glycosyltransferase [Rhodospirillaceae bacterium]|nr:glycosyltransferase [Rhodospirillaceae bacterium]
MGERGKLIDDLFRNVERGDFAGARELSRDLREIFASPNEADIFDRLIDYRAAPGLETLGPLIAVQIEKGTAPTLLAFSWSGLGQTPIADFELLHKFTVLSVLVMSRAPPADEIVYTIVLGAGTGYTTRFDDCDYLFFNLVMPLLRKAAGEARYNLLMLLESAIYVYFVKNRDSEVNFAARYGMMAGLFRDAGARFATENDMPPLPALPAPGTRPRVMFLVHSASRLAHVETMLASFRGYRSQAHQPFDPFVIVDAGHEPSLERACADLNIGIEFLAVSHPHENSPLERMAIVRRTMAERGCVALVFVSLVLRMGFYFGARIAPVQIWWSMKYSSFEIPEIDGYITGGQSDFRELHGRTWRAIPHGDSDWFDPALAPRAAALRAQLGADGRVILGCFGREEKLRDAAFLDAVCTILARHPQCMFLWTGRTRDPLIEQAFEKSGVTGQTVFIGWVDTKLYAQVLDVFLDSFPLPAGFTIYQAMAAGVPAVLYAVPDASLGVQASISRLYFGSEGEPAQQARVAEIFAKNGPRPLYLLARSVEDYVAHADALIDSVELRRAVGAAGRQFIAEFMSDAGRMGAAFARHFEEIIAGRLKALAPATLSVQPAGITSFRGVNAPAGLAGTP